MHFFVPDVQGIFFYFCGTRLQTLSVLHKSTVTQVPSRLVSCAGCRHTAAPFVRLSQTLNQMLVEMATIISRRFAIFVGPPCVLYFGLHFRIVTYLCRNRFPNTMLYMAAVAKTAVTSKFDFSFRPLSAQRACMANTRDVPTNLMSEVCMEQCTLCSFYFR